MAENSKIQWTHHTFNPWRGCTKVSDGCKHCYADTLSKRNPSMLGVWGTNGTRVVAASAAWREPIKWDKVAREAGERHRVFCASLADVFEGPETMPADSLPIVEAARRRMFKLIGATPNLDWLLLTKRPQNILRLTRKAIDTFDDPEFDFNAAAEPNGLDAASFRELYPNIWLGTSVENEETANERIPLLRKVPATVRFLSIEPQLSAIDLTGLLDGIHWVICGGESGAKARSFDISWARSLRDQCAAAGVAFFMKQFGEKPTGEWKYSPLPMLSSDSIYSSNSHWILNDKKGGDMEEWPADLRVRDFPKVAS